MQLSKGLVTPGGCRSNCGGPIPWRRLPGRDVIAPLTILDWEDWGRAPEGFDAATRYAYTLLQPDTAARVGDAFPVVRSPAGLTAEATVCAQLLQAVARGDNLALED